MKISLLELGDVRCRLAETFGDLQRLLENFAASFVQFTLFCSLCSVHFEVESCND